MTDHNMVGIPAKIRKKYSIKKGTKIVFVENRNRILQLIPAPPLSELFGIAREHKDILIAGIKEIEAERTRKVDIDGEKRT